METLIGALFVAAWLSSLYLLAVCVVAINASTRCGCGVVCHIHKLMLVTSAAGYFCIVFMAPAGLSWGVIGGCMVLVSRGIESAMSSMLGYVKKSAHRVDDAFNFDL